ncbi:putative NADH dehydrogenase [ubiquinone] 1 alpha subcomplex subunit 5, mitochondrial [Capsicum annuum]|uniref:NADH dehydrogenase [ubiquinone] 1 alpha subcomplex subunit 5, mitochondrial n=1 Tax=Capsicum annuum TaxID=4072 RepID=A0A2G2Z939_CAPAN|nr:putative NADH dehydrogenase [ubiquinone] 1 alpha subcomplex subunit 5, mitochondrial [Capsicum annuum]PHT78518.1 putative NADH dehydrogenase [ubiquinone] 1 alpha subcomplex subunit 5, mitochondrial [Capsicum annuum]
MIEKRIGCGQVEELIEEAQDELKLIGHMNEWKPWGIPNDYECEVIENDAPVPKHIPLPVLVLSLRNSIRQWRLFLENWTLVQKRMNLQFLRVNQSRVFQKLPLVID